MQVVVENSRSELRSAAKEVASKPSDYIIISSILLVLMARVCNIVTHLVLVIGLKIMNGNKWHHSLL